MSNRYAIEQILLEEQGTLLMTGQDLSLKRKVLLMQLSEAQLPNGELFQRIGEGTEQLDEHYLHVMDVVSTNRDGVLAVMRYEEGGPLSLAIEGHELSLRSILQIIHELGLSVAKAEEAGVAGFSTTAENLWLGTNKLRVINHWEPSQAARSGSAGLGRLFGQLCLRRLALPTRTDELLEEILEVLPFLSEEQIEDISALIRLSGQPGMTTGDFMREYSNVMQHLAIDPGKRRSGGQTSVSPVKAVQAPPEPADGRVRGSAGSKSEAASASPRTDQPEAGKAAPSERQAASSNKRNGWKTAAKWGGVVCGSICLSFVLGYAIGWGKDFLASSHASSVQTGGSTQSETSSAAGTSSNPAGAAPGQSASGTAKSGAGGSAGASGTSANGAGSAAAGSGTAGSSDNTGNASGTSASSSDNSGTAAGNTGSAAAGTGAGGTVPAAAGSPNGNPANVPNVVGMQQQDAQNFLHQQGFHYFYYLMPNQAPVGQVYKQDPAAGSQAIAGDQVTIWVSKGPGN